MNLKPMQFDGIIKKGLNENLLNTLKELYNDEGCVYSTEKTYEHNDSVYNFKYKYVIVGTDMRATCDPQYDEEYMYYELQLVIMPESLSKEVRNSIIQSAGTSEITEYDVWNEGLRINMLRHHKGDKLGTDENQLEWVNNIANLIDCVDSERGFYLDKYQNRLCETGWDMIENQVLTKLSV